VGHTERLGVLGGTFDPPHVGHLVAAVDSRAAVDLDRVLLVVAGDPWQKRDRVVASAEDRLALVVAERIVRTASCPVLTVRHPEHEFVTADTLEALTEPGRELFLILGADAVANMPTWKRLEDTKSLATVVVVERAGEHAEPPGDGWRVQHVAIPRLDVSSSDVRARLASGRPIDGLVPPGVVREIAERRLYTAE